tara:strand:+ start:92 stop:445 length:354 start_codon:yes stop_codon:yes gene_type:complete
MKISSLFLLASIFICSIIYVDSLINLSKAKDSSIIDSVHNENLSYNGVLLIPENAPALSSIFGAGNKGPHSSFISNQSCEKCHTQSSGTEIMGKVIPAIPHKVINNCNACHSLASSE